MVSLQSVWNIALRSAKFGRLRSFRKTNRAVKLRHLLFQDLTVSMDSLFEGRNQQMGHLSRASRLDGAPAKTFSSVRACLLCEF